jgi:8-oxo-dGTP diphosphatase
MDNRRYPKFPLASVSGIVVCYKGVLLVKRKKPPNKGLWVIPGGALEIGETQMDAIVREVHEEAGIESETLGFINTKDVLLWDTMRRIEYQYMVNRYLLIAKSHEARPGCDEADACWFSIDDLPVKEMPCHVVELLEDFRDLIEVLMKYLAVRGEL